MPVPAKDQLLIKVEAASVNPVDWKVIQAGLFKLFLPAKLPYIPGATSNIISVVDDTVLLSHIPMWKIGSEHAVAGNDLDSLYYQKRGGDRFAGLMNEC